MKYQGIIRRALALVFLGLAALLGLVLAVVASTVVSSLFPSVDSWPEAVTRGLLRMSGIVVGMLCFSIGVVRASDRSLLDEVRKEGFASKPHLKALIASLTIGFGFGMVYFYAFFLN